MCKISVIVPVYNNELLIGRCIGSILAQTYTNYEIIIVNDGSTDHSIQVCNTLSAKDSRIKVYDKENGGSNSARKYGVERSTGEFIRFVDSDDLIPQKSLELLLNKLQKYDLDIVQGINSYMTYDGNCVQSHYEKEGIFDTNTFLTMVLNGKCNSGPWASLYKKELFSKDTFNLPKEVKLNEDKYMNVCLGLKAKRIGIFNDINIYTYMQNEKSVTQSYEFKSTKPFELLYNHIERVITEHGLIDDFRETITTNKLFAAVSCCLHNKHLTKEKWVRQTIAETESIPLSRRLSLARFALKYNKCIFPLFYTLNEKRRKIKSN